LVVSSLHCTCEQNTNHRQRQNAGLLLATSRKTSLKCSSHGVRFAQQNKSIKNSVKQHNTSIAVHFYMLWSVRRPSVVGECDTQKWPSELRSSVLQNSAHFERCIRHFWRPVSHTCLYPFYGHRETHNFIVYGEIRK
jgi:hypothetical protein